MSTLGVVVFSLKNMRHVSRCLESVQWADGVTLLRMDQENQEGCLTAVKESSERNGTDWVLHLWGEESVEVELGKELRMVCRSELATSPPFYLVPIQTRLLGRWVEGSLWGPVPAPRLRRRLEGPPSGWWSAAPEGRVGTPGLLQGWIGDYSCDELKNGMDRINSVSSFWAMRMQLEGRSVSPTTVVTRSLRVWTRLLFREGRIRGGLAGLSLSALAGYTTLASGMKLWELRQGKT